MRKNPEKLSHLYDEWQLPDYILINLRCFYEQTIYGFVLRLAGDSDYVRGVCRECSGAKRRNG